MSVAYLSGLFSSRKREGRGNESVFEFGEITSNSTDVNRHGSVRLARFLSTYRDLESHRRV